MLTHARFPDDIAYGSAGGPVFSTSITTNAGGFEQRCINWQHPRNVYNVAHGVKSKSQLDELIAFFRARRGRADGFRFKDWGDYTLVNQLLDVADGNQTEFQIVKHYESHGVRHTRTITKPLPETITVYVDDVIEPESNYTISDATGVLTFASAPVSGASIRVDGEFDVFVRFETDQLVARLDDVGVYSWGDIALVELREAQGE